MASRVAVIAPLAVVLLLAWSGATPGAEPPLELKDLEGRVHRIEDYRGKVVLVNFWATWCAPCREEMPSLEQLRQGLADRPFVVLAVNVGESGRVAGKYLQSISHGFTVLLDADGRATKAWGARILPATYVLGPEGEIRMRHFGALDWASPESRRRITALMP